MAACRIIQLSHEVRWDRVYLYRRVKPASVEFTVASTFEIRKLRVTNLDQTTLEFAFEAEKLNPPLANSLFQFQAPPGAELVDEGG